MKAGYRLFLAVLIITAAFMFSCGSRRDAAEVVTTTSVLSSIAADIGEPLITASALVAPGSCPGHFDIKVRHLQQLERSGTLLAHGFEIYLSDIESSVSNPSFKTVKVPIEQGWLTQEGAVALYRKTAAYLIDIMPEHREHFEAGLDRALMRIDEADREVRLIAEKNGFQGRRVICNAHMRGMLEYFGFEVVATYGSSEELAPGQVSDIIAVSMEEGVELVVDNMQAGADTGEKVFAEDLGIPHAAVSNFPGVLPGAETLYETMLANANIIKSALHEGGGE